MTLEYPEDLQYLDSHEYVRLDGDIATVGISAFAIEELGDIVFLELPESGEEVDVKDQIGTIESVKAVSDIYSPVSGTIIDRNDILIDSPEDIANDPYGEGWLVKIKLDDPNDELEDTMTAQEYQAMVEAEQE